MSNWDCSVHADKATRPVSCTKRLGFLPVQMLQRPTSVLVVGRCPATSDWLASFQRRGTCGDAVVPFAEEALRNSCAVWASCTGIVVFWREASGARWRIKHFSPGKDHGGLSTDGLPFLIRSHCPLLSILICLPRSKLLDPKLVAARWAPGSPWLVPSRLCSGPATRWKRPGDPGRGAFLCLGIL